MERIVFTGSHVHSETRLRFEVLIDDRQPGNNRPVSSDGSSIVPTEPRKIGFALDETEDDR